MLIEKTTSHTWVISETINGYLVTRRYIGYSKREAIAAFKRETKGTKS